MTVGTRSMLYGAHAIWWHPFWVALAWTLLFGFPTDFRLWVAFFVHDHYWGLPNMDGDEGKRHPEPGATLMARWFGTEWGRFTMFHSRSYAKMYGQRVSALCAADKLATAIEPQWFYLLRVIATGEVEEYRTTPHERYDGNADIWGWCSTMRSIFKEEALRIAAEYYGSSTITPS